jgi:hypothetical protein
MLNAALPMAILDLIPSVYSLHDSLTGYQNSWNIPHCPVVLDLSYSVLGMAVLRFSLP